MKSEQWMVSQGDAQDQVPRVIQEGLNSYHLYIQIDQRLNVLHVELYIKPGSALLHLLFVLNATNQATFQGYVCLSLLPPVHPAPIGIQGDHGTAEVEAIEATETVDPNMLCKKLKHLILQNL